MTWLARSRRALQYSATKPLTFASRSSLFTIRAGAPPKGMRRLEFDICKKWETIYAAVWATARHWLEERLLPFERHGARNLDIRIVRSLRWRTSSAN